VPCAITNGFKGKPNGLIVVTMMLPYIDKAIPDLESLFHANRHDPEILQALNAELMLRSSRLATALYDPVDLLLENRLEHPI